MRHPSAPTECSYKVGRFFDLTGMRFGKWHVVERAPRRHGSTMYRCFCECSPNIIHVIQACHLVRGESTQCRRCGYTGPAIKAAASKTMDAILKRAGAQHRMSDVGVVLMPFIGEIAKGECRECGQVPVKGYCRRKVAQCYVVTVPGARVRYRNQAWDMLVSQLEERQGLCANPKCDTPLLFNQGLGKSCHLDHDESTGYLCGWLCPTCNPGIGYFDHDADRLEGAAALRKVHQKRTYYSSIMDGRPSFHVRGFNPVRAGCDRVTLERQENGLTVG